MQRLVAWDPACLPRRRRRPPLNPWKWPTSTTRRTAWLLRTAARRPPRRPRRPDPGRAPAGELGSIGEHERAIDFSSLPEPGAPQAPAPTTATDTFEAAPPAPAPAPASSGQHHDFLSDLFSDDYGGKNCKKAAEYGYVSLGRPGAAKARAAPRAVFRTPVGATAAAAAAAGAAAGGAQGGAGLRARGLQAEGGGRSPGGGAAGMAAGFRTRCAPTSATRRCRAAAAEPVHVLVVQPARHAEPRRRQGIPRPPPPATRGRRRRPRRSRARPRRRWTSTATSTRSGGSATTRGAQKPRQGQDAQPGDAAQGPGAHGRERAAPEEGGAAVARAQHPAELLFKQPPEPLLGLLRPLLLARPRARPRGRPAGPRAAGAPRPPRLRERLRAARAPLAAPVNFGTGALGSAGSASVILIFYYIYLSIFLSTQPHACRRGARPWCYLKKRCLCVQMNDKLCSFPPTPSLAPAGGPVSKLMQSV